MNIDGIFNLKTEDGIISLKVTKRAIYNFEKDRNASFLGLFVSGSNPENLTIDWRGIVRFDTSIDLAFHCQPVPAKYTKDQLIDIADNESLTAFVTFVVQQYSQHMGTIAIEEGEQNPLEIGSAATPKKSK